MDVYFILHYHLFLHNFLLFFLNDSYFLNSNVLNCFWLRNMPSIIRPYATRAMEGMGVIWNVCRCVQGERGIMPHWYLHHYSISFHVRHYTSLFMFCLMVSCFICRNLTLPKRPCLLEMFFLSNEINFCCHEISFFTLNCFPKPKLTKSLLVLIKYFSVIPYFEKLLSSHRYLFDKSFYIDVYRAWFILLLLLLLLHLMLLM